jgi:hypothetical protein
MEKGPWNLLPSSSLYLSSIQQGSFTISYCLVSDVGSTCRKNGKKMKNIAHTCGLEFHFASISGLGGSILPKNVKIIVPYCTIKKIP